MRGARPAAWGRCPSAGAPAGRAGRRAGGVPPASCRTPAMAAASAAPSVNRRDPVKVRVRRGDRGHRPVGGDLAGHPGGPGAEQDRAGARAAAGVQDRGQPAGRARLGGGDQRDARPSRPWRRAGVRQVVARAAEAGQGELEGFQFAEGRVRRGGDGQAGDRRGAGAGQQPGGVGGRDDHGGQPGPCGRGLGEQGGEDRAGGRLGTGAGQAEAAEGHDVDVDGGLSAVAADAGRDRAGRQLAPGGVLRPRLRHAVRVLGGRGAAAVRVRRGEGFVQVGVRIFGGSQVLAVGAADQGSVLVTGLRRGRAGGAAQGADDLGQRRRFRRQRAGRAGAGPVAAAPLDGGQGNRGGDHDRDADPDQRAGRQPHRDLGQMRAPARRAAAGGRPRARGRLGWPCGRPG